ncbi:sensor histidine kinase [Clostridium butyricum]|uniref:sensor histidine kinase n=1 Tax=Clostridium butyricum TaxID=1492 RepID=UPI0032BF8E36
MKIKKKFYYSQKIYLFFIYGLLVIVLLSIFFASFYSYYSKNIYKDAKTKSESLCTSVHKSISTELDNLSTISMNIVYSNAIKSNFISFAKNNTDKIELQNYNVSRSNVLAIYDIITAILGPLQSASQVNLYTLDGIGIGSGLFQGVTQVDLSRFSWTEGTIGKNGSKYVSTIDGINSGNEKDISLSRLFFNSTNEPQGIVQVIQDYNVIFSLIKELKEKNSSASFYVYDDQNNLIYPEKTQKNEIPNYLKIIKKDNLQPLTGSFINVPQDEPYLITYETVDSYNWTIVVSEPKSEVFKSLRSSEKGFIVIIIFSLSSTLLLCFIISSRFTYPLMRLTKDVNNITLNNVLNNKDIMSHPIDTNITEIIQLNNSFLEMYDKLKSSSREILLLKSEETRAKLQATQSLVNPHFLYNSLTTISIMAEENMNSDIIKMCHSLCDYFRYISSFENTSVTLNEEFSYTKKYIECMEMRYGQDFIFESHMDKKTETIIIPKLIIQPIVENAFKHGFSSAPPWNLKISSEIKDDKWLISVEDNGGCLTNNAKEELIATFHDFKKNHKIDTLKIGGMGLKNVYLRLILLYNEEAVFEINNSIPNKTVFIIGGPINYSKEDFNEHYISL